jgi:transposase
MKRSGKTLGYCPQCLDKQRQINQLLDEVGRLKDRLRYQERTAKEGPFGSSTPSSKVPVKPSSLPERQAKTGGGRQGHKGNGRKAVPEDQAHRVVEVDGPDRCPDCGGNLEDKGSRPRTVLEAQPVVVQRIIYRLARKRCRHCGKTVGAKAPGVLPKCQWGNGLLTHLATQHYLYGATLGTLEKQTGVGVGSIVEALHQLARRLGSVPDRLLKEYRLARVRHADETSWRTDGANGYAWLFTTADLSLFRFRSTRAACVPKEVLGSKRLPGVLVVDRYAGYNAAPCKIQYCYAHLLRDLQDIEKDFPDQVEVQAFVQSLAPLLAGAMTLRGQKLSQKQFAKQAAILAGKIRGVINRQASHPAIQSYQDIFRQKADRLYHWAKDPGVPAENNFAERELRPLVVSRKISFGSQSKKGAATREVLMSVLHTLRKRTTDPAAVLRACLNQLALSPAADPHALLFGKSRPKPP